MITLTSGFHSAGRQLVFPEPEPGCRDLVVGRGTPPGRDPVIGGVLEDVMIPFPRSYDDLKSA